MRLDQFFKSKGYSIDDRLEMDSYIEEFKSWYKGNVPAFQNYFIYNGQNKIYCKRKTLNMWKKVSEDFANLLLNEKVQFHIGDKSTQEKINPILDENDFYVLANEAIEKTWALGTGAFVLSLGDLTYNPETEMITTDMAKIKIEFATADKIYPLSYTKNKITECAFATKRVINNKPMVYVTIHRKATAQDEGITEGNYIIENYLFKETKGGNLVNMSDSLLDTIRVLDTGDIYPWFSVLRPNVTNNISLDNPMGISVLANSIDVIKGIDIAYDSFVNEFILGKKRIFVEDDLLQPDTTTGELKYIFDTNDTIFHTLPAGSGDNTGKKITESDMTLRIDEHEKGIQQGLNLLSSKLQLGQNYYSFDRGNLTTATQVVSENSDLFRTIKKHEIMVENCLYDLFKAMLSIMKNQLHIAVNPDTEITIDFDDSIIEDTAEIKRQALLELNAGLIDNIEYFMLTRKMDEKQAKKYVESIKKRMEAQLEQEPQSETNDNEE